MSLSAAAHGGRTLWLETQNVLLDRNGHSMVILGSTTSRLGLPTDIFASGEARWLGVQVTGQAEQPRVMLLAVPNARGLRGFGVQQHFQRSNGANFPTPG